MKHLWRLSDSRHWTWILWCWHPVVWGIRAPLFRKLFHRCTVSALRIITEGMHGCTLNKHTSPPSPGEFGLSHQRSHKPEHWAAAAHHVWCSTEHGVQADGAGQLPPLPAVRPLPEPAEGEESRPPHPSETLTLLHRQWFSGCPARLYRVVARKLSPHKSQLLQPLLCVCFKIQILSRCK